MTFFDTALKRAEMVRNWRKHAESVAAAAKELLSKVDVYVFGSVARGEHVAASDVDMLIVSDEIPETMLDRAALKVELEKKAGLPYYHPFELHLVKPDEAEPYLRRAGEHLIRL